MACVDILSDEEDAPLCSSGPIGSTIQPPVPSFAVQCPVAQPQETSAEPAPNPRGLRRVVIAQLDLADSDDESEAVTKATGTTADSRAISKESDQPSALEPSVSNAGTQEMGKAGDAGSIAGSTNTLNLAVDSDDDDDESCLTALTITADINATPVVPSDAASQTKSEPSAVQTSKRPLPPLSSQSAPKDDDASPKGPPLKKAVKADGKAGKPEVKEKKISKDEMETRILQYVVQQNRPYNAQNVFDNMHGVIPKSQVPIILDNLCSTGRLIAKEYGKNRIFLPVQSGTSESIEQETQGLQEAVGRAEASLQGLRSSIDDSKKRLSEIRSKHSCVSEALEITEKIEELEKKMSLLQNQSDQDGPQLSEEDVKTAEEVLSTATVEWKRRKRLCMEMLGRLSELTNLAMGKVIDQYGVDTDEACSES